jgi:outer membrane receptor for ferrienterochelin and colicins
MKNIIVLFSLLLLGNYLPAQSANELTIFVDGICGMCETRIETAALGVRGVVGASWAVDTRQLTVDIDPAKFTEDRLHAAVAAAGHDTKEVQASDTAYDELHGCCKYRDTEVVAAHRPAAGSSDPTKVSFFVDGICGMCQTRIETAAMLVRGVSEAYWDVDTRQLMVTVEPANFNIDRLHRTIANVGHDTEQIIATDAAYENLHGCCKYRDAEVIADHRKPDGTFKAEGGAPGGVAEFEPFLTQGKIVEKAGRRSTTPIIGATVQWLGSEVGTTTDTEGNFELPRIPGLHQIVVQYVGYAADTLAVEQGKFVQITLTDAVTLDEVEVKYRRRTTEVSFIEPLKVQQIGGAELLKAACCNLSESFETNPAVDASVTDAVTGTRQIKMLGLAGPYVQINRENIPDIRGLSALYGMTYTPGPWIESMQLLKGPGPVVNGFESMAGQINVELKKPQAGERLHVNLYGNEGGRMEANVNWRSELNERWSTAIMVHGEHQNNTNDRNGDDFLDNPLRDDWIVLNRWRWMTNSGWRGQFGLKYTAVDRQSGQVGFEPDETPVNNAVWGAQWQTRRTEAWAKIGKVYEDRPYASFGFMVSALNHQQESVFGTRRYDAEQQSVYTNLIYQSIIHNTTHQWKAGASFQYDRFDELLADATYLRNEWVPGAYLEYTYLPTEAFTLVAGLRGDYHNQFGFFTTPRLFLRFMPQAGTVIRASVGQGRRTATLIAENIGALASARQWIIDGTNADTPYGLDQEVAWNFGLNYTQSVLVGTRELLLMVDAYHTAFQQQIVIDYDANPQELSFYNLDGKSFSNNLQLQAEYELLPRFDVRLAYRFNDVQTTYRGGQDQLPLVARHRGFLNLAYETSTAWAFDFTLNRQGQQRLPFTRSNPEPLQLAESSPAYWLANAQISKTWQENFSVYLGAENLFNFRQDNPILAADQPFSEFFDSSLIWGPVFGRMVYAGLRYTLE